MEENSDEPRPKKAKQEEVEPNKDTNRHVNSKLLEKFEQLKKRRQELIARSSAKRIKQLQNSVLEKVTEEFKRSDDLDTLISHQVALPNDLLQSKSTTSEEKVSSASKDNADVTECSQAVGTGASKDDTSSMPSVGTSSSGQGWMDFKPFLNVNSHLHQNYREAYAPKTKLEKHIDKAVELGDLSTAEELSDHLAKRELGKKIVDAIEAKRFLDKKKKEEEILEAKKKKKLHWCFDHKQRWETKSNM